jgi:hypothetical protein
MWARVVEIMLACWLAISPPVFYGADATSAQWAFDLAAAALIATLAAVSYWPPARLAHLGIILPALALIAFGMWASSPTPLDQNHIVVGLLLLLFAIIPNEATQPPRAWQDYTSRD